MFKYVRKRSRARSVLIVSVLLGAATSGANARNPATGTLPKSDWAAITAAYKSHRDAVVPVGGEFHARNAGQQWVARFDRSGFTVQPSGAEWTWGLALESWGRAGLETLPGEAVPAAQAERLSYRWSDGLEEWFLNGEQGLEHGFSLNTRPPGQGTVSLRMRVRGGLRGTVSADGAGALFHHSSGRAAIRYSALHAWDADRRAVPAQMKLNGESLAIELDDRGARYPVTVDPIAQQAYMKASNTESLDEFGAAVAISGDTVVVGAPEEDSAATGVNGNQASNGSAGSGAAYVFIRVAGIWTQQAYLKASNTQAGAKFGASVSVSGDLIVVGAPGEETEGLNSGAAYVFTRSGSAWTQGALLKGPNTEAGDKFGEAVAASGNTVIVGAPAESSSATGVGGSQNNNGALLSGAVYVFSGSGTNWPQQAYLKASNTGAGDQFGGAVAMSGETLVVGAAVERSNATGVNGDQNNNSALASGAAYVFIRTGAAWSQQAYLKASNTNTFDDFGHSVAIAGDRIVVGAPGEASASVGVNGNQSDNSSTNSGAAYVFLRTGSVWSQEAYLKASNTGNGDQFGKAVAISADRIAAGADWEDSSAIGINGNQSDNGAGQSGAVYLFARTGAAWTPESYVKASNTRVNGFFGIAAAVSGSTVIVGSKWEASNATGVNGDGTNASAPAAGAGYIFGLTAGCSYSVSGSTSIGFSGGSGSVTVTTSPGCAWTAVSNSAWLTVTGGASGSGSGLVNYTAAANTGLARTATISVAGEFVILGQQAAPGASVAPTASAPSPAAGTGSSGTFTFTFEDGNGTGDLDVLNVLINSALDGRNACYIAFVPSQGLILLINDAGEAGGPYAGVAGLPGGGVIANSQCSVDLGASSVNTAGNTLTLTLKMNFQPAFGGNRVVYVAARDKAAHNTGWLSRAVWTVPGATSNGTAVVGMTPRRAEGSALSLTTVVSDASGFVDLNVVNVLINNAIDGRNACYLALVRSTGQVFLVNDAGDAGGPFPGSITIPGAGSVSNSQCAINAAAASVSGAGTELTVTLNMTFTGAFAGDRIIYVAARDMSENNSGWQAMGTITVP